MIRALIADDQVLVRDGLQLIIDAQPDMEVVGTAGTGIEALDAVLDLDPDIVLMDIRMPDLDGIAATRKIHERCGDSAPKIIVLTTFSLDEYVLDALHAGASGFLLKDTPKADLVAAVRTVAQGDGLLSPSVTRSVIEELVRTRPRPRTERRLDDLTAREREILVLIGRGSSNAEIAASLFISEGTVKTHVSRVLMKLGLRDRVQAVVLAYETGLIVPGDA
jgi:DNA-binding NarL/FixJ family response regulator